MLLLNLGIEISREIMNRLSGVAIVQRYIAVIPITKIKIDNDTRIGSGRIP